MKKLLISFILVLGAFALTGAINAFQKRKVTHNKYSSFEQYSDSLYSTKYRECITLGVFPEGWSTHGKLTVENEWDLMKVNSSINRYAQSLDSTIKNLSAIDAHDFLHQEFDRSKNILNTSKNLSWIRAHYHREIIRICYDRDKLLNLGSGNHPSSL